MKIIIVEDDYMQSSAIKSEILSKFSKIEVQVIDSELGFQSNFGEMLQNPPKIILMDVMLRWTKPSQNMTLPPENIREEGFYKAGFRCHSLLKKQLILKDIPVIFYTVLDKDDIQSELDNISGESMYIVKNKDVSPLIGKIGRLIR
jgi:CheY-like chemotaxis protein